MGNRFPLGSTARITHVVAADDTAAAVGSGDVPMLATPRLVALAEAATVLAVASALESGQTSVGTRVELDHLLASPIGDELHIDATLAHVDGRRLLFEVAAERTVDGQVVGRGRVSRVVVDRERFLSRAGA